MTDILARLKGNGQSWTFAEVIAEIEQLRAMVQEAKTNVELARTAWKVWTPEYDAKDVTEFLDAAAAALEKVQ